MRPSNEFPLVPKTQRPYPGTFQLRATQDLFNAIQFADEADAPRLIELAINNGANINALNYEGYGAIEQAVKNNKIRTLKFLFAKGASLPEVGPDGFDILMLAASNGHTDMAFTMINVANILISAPDANGMTALHYAVKNQHVQTAAMLLEQGCDINSKTKSMPVHELADIFSDTHDLNGANITPFMIAVAQSDYEMVKLFLSKNEKIEIGAKHSILLALKNNDSQMLEIFLKNEIKFNICNPPQNQTLLEYALNNQINNCLQILIKACPIDHSKTQYNQKLLEIAVKKSNYHAASLLLTHGVLPDDTISASGIWQLAADLPDSGKMLTLLAKSKSRKWKNITAGDEQVLLNLISKTKPSLAAYASIGLLPLTAKKLVDRLAQLLTPSQGMTEAQVMTEIAKFLEEIPAENFAVPPPLPGNLMLATAMQSQDSAIELSKIHSIEQIATLKKLGQIVNQHFLEKLPQYLTTEFFNSCNAECNEAGQLFNLIKNKLTNTSGLPEITAKIIANGWCSADRLIKSSNIINGSPTDSIKFNHQLARNLISISIEEILKSENISANYSLYEINKIILQFGTPLDTFCANPIKELRQLENRRNLQPVDIASITKELCMKFGIPPDLSEILAHIWSASVDEVRKSSDWNNSMQMNFSLQKAFSLHLQNKIQTLKSDSSVDPDSLQSEIIRKLLQWHQADKAT